MIFLYADLYFLSGCWFEVKKTSFIIIWTTLWTNKAMNQQMNSSGLFSDSRWSLLCSWRKDNIFGPNMYFFVYICSF